MARRLAMARRPSDVSASWCMDHCTLASTTARSWASGGSDGPEPRQDAPQQRLDARPRPRAPELEGERRLHRAAAPVPQHHEEIPEPLVEQELRRNPVVAAPEDRGERRWPLASRASSARPGSSRRRSLVTNRPLPVIRRLSAAAPGSGGRRARVRGGFLDRGMPYCTARARARRRGRSPPLSRLG